MEPNQTNQNQASEPLKPSVVLPANEKDVKENKDMAALSYVWILSIVMYIIKHDSPFVRFHAKQGMVIFALSLFTWFIPLVGRLLEVILLILAIFGFVAASKGQWKDVPLIGPLSRGEWKLVKTSLVVFWKDLRTAIEKLVKSSRSSHP